MGSPTLTKLVGTLSDLAAKASNDRIRSTIKRQMNISRRQGSWFQLNVQERSILKLALSLKISFKSVDLLRAIASVLKRLQVMSGRLFALFLRAAEVARAFSDAATRWGHAAASSWKSDSVYIAFLARFFVSPLPE
jgi:hypothetical protein